MIELADQLAENWRRKTPVKVGFRQLGPKGPLNWRKTAVLEPLIRRSIGGIGGNENQPPNSRFIEGSKDMIGAAYRAGMLRAKMLAAMNVDTSREREMETLP